MHCSDGKKREWTRPEVVTAISSVLVALLVGTFGAIWTVRTSSIDSDEKWNNAVLQVLDGLSNIEKDGASGPAGQELRGVLAARRQILLFRLDALLESRPSSPSLDPKMMSLFAPTYARAGRLDKAKEYWEKSLNDDKSTFAIKVPAALQLRVAAERNGTEVKAARDRLSKVIKEVPNPENTIEFYMNWADIEQKNREFAYAVDLASRAVELYPGTKCSTGARGEQRESITSFLCLLEQRFPKETARILYRLYSIKLTDVNYCPGDLDVAVVPSPDLMSRYCETLHPPNSSMP